MTDDVITRISEKGEITLPEAVLERQHWDAGTSLVVEETRDGVLLKKRPIFTPTSPEDVFGMIKHEGKPKTVEEMEQGILNEARRSFVKSIDPD